MTNLLARLNEPLMIMISPTELRPTVETAKQLRRMLMERSEAACEIERLIMENMYLGRLLKNLIEAEEYCDAGEVRKGKFDAARRAVNLLGVSNDHKNTR
jgi:hypothetical protein